MENISILIADDERNIRESVSLILMEEGCETRLASTGKEALDLLNKEDFDILITDLKMPEKEGRHSVPFNIDQTKLSRLVLSGEGQFDEIRVGPTFESVIGQAK